MDIAGRAQRVKLLILDVDGVMTDGKVVYADNGQELKFFDSRDGHGIKLLMRTGVEVAIITGRASEAVRHRAENLGITIVYQRALNKITAYEDIRSQKGFADDQICVMGDDLPDLPMMRRAGLSFAVPDGVDEVRSAAHGTTLRAGGNGAVREVCECIMRAQGTWEAVTARYFNGEDAVQ